MRGQTLLELLSDLKAECGYSQNAAHGINNRDSLVQVLKRTQRRLWSDWDWMHLRVSRDLVMNAGQRYYNVPVDLSYDRIDRAEFKFGGQWVPLRFGIGEREYSIYDPRQDQRSWPLTAWDICEDPQNTAGNIDNRDMVEVWPMPSNSGDAGSLEGNVRFTGIRNLHRFEQDADRCDLDGDLIVLSAAAETLMRDRKDDAQAKMQAATTLYMRLRGNQEKNRSFSLAGPQAFADDDASGPVTVAQPVPFAMGSLPASPAPPPLGLMFSLNAARNGDYVGYGAPGGSPPASFGLLTPDTIYGARIIHLLSFYNPGVNDVFLFRLDGTRAKNFFTQIVVNGKVYKSADANYASPAGGLNEAQWIWPGNAGLADGEIYTVAIL